MKSIACFVTIGLAAASPWASAQVTSGDFNNDGLADLAVGVPNETKKLSTFDSGCFCITTTNQPGAGGVSIIFGGSSGLTQTGSQSLSRGSAAVSTNGHYGTALVAGRFRGPGFGSDLAVVTPGIPNIPVPTRGAIGVHFSGSGKLGATPNQTFFGADLAFPGNAVGGNLGFRDDVTMAGGDFNGDGFADLAVEVTNLGFDPNETDSGVLVIRGSATGLDRANAQLLVVTDEMSPDNLNCNVTDCVELQGHVGLAAGDLDNDGRDDLVIGASGIRRIDESGGSVDGGPRRGFLIIRGTSSNAASPVGLTASGARLTLANNLHGPKFGSTIAIADFTGDGVKDIALGDPSTSGSAAQRVDVFRGALVGFSFSFAFALSQVGTNPAVQPAEFEDRFGAALATLDMNNDGLTDLAVGAPGESVPNSAGAGAVTVFLGAPGGMQNGARQTFTQSDAVGPLGLPCCFTGAGFGASLAAGNYGVAAPADLAIGSPTFSIPLAANGTQPITAAGSVVALYGAQGAGVFFAAGFVQNWTQTRSVPACTTGICFMAAGTAGLANHFGAAVR